MRLVLVVLLAILPTRALGQAQDQLYTGDAATVEPGRCQFQTYLATAFSAGLSLSGTSFTFGATDRLDARLSHGYLWNDHGPNARNGPNLGAKWRFVGDGKRKPSFALSCICTLNQKVDSIARKNNLGALLIAQAPVKRLWALANLGRVWVGENVPDLRYLALAVAGKSSNRALVALQYVEIDEVGRGSRGGGQIVGAIVYRDRGEAGYSVQVGYLPWDPTVRWTVTLGVSKHFDL